MPSTPSRDDLQALVLQYLRTAGQPVALKSILQAPELREVGAKPLREALDRLVSEGQVYAWGGKRLGLEPEESALRRMILAAVGDGRVMAKEVARQGKQDGWKPAAVQAALDRCLAEGGLFSAGSGAARMISRQPMAGLEGEILRIAGQQPWPKKALAAAACEALPWHKPSQAGKVIQSLLSAGKLRESRPAKALFALPGDPEEFIRRAAERAYREAQETWRSALGNAPTPSNLPDRILDSILRVEPQKGMLVTMRQLRQSEWLREVSKEDFDRAVLDLARTQRIALSQHSAPFHLSEAEREYLIRDDRGVYYGGVSWRG